MTRAESRERGNETRTKGEKRMRQSISTKYLGATNTRGSRVKAKSSSGLSVTLSWDDALNTDDNHQAAALALASKLNWLGRWVAGGDRDGRGNVYVNDDGDGFSLGPVA
jgi:hypothetical protein